MLDRSALGYHGGDHGLDRLFLADVADLKADAAAVFANFAGGFFQFVGLAPDQHHMGAEGGQFMGGAATDATAATGDQNGLAVEQAGFED